MDHFTSALISRYTTKIPPEFDWFAPLIGDWDFHYYDNHNGIRRDIPGEWLFRRILNGTGIGDLFLLSTRDTMTDRSQAGGEYGMAIRIFNAEEKCYDVTYTCETCMQRLRFVKEGGKRIGTAAENPNEKWVFSCIHANSFQWNRITVLENGSWQPASSVYATRKRR
ncbi:MAG: hypothetical protein ACI3WQ_12355 [Faecousia sp.]